MKWIVVIERNMNVRMMNNVGLDIFIQNFLLYTVAMITYPEQEKIVKLKM